MAWRLSSYRAQLEFFLQAMVDEGIVNNEFLQLQSLKATVRRDVVIRSIILYSNATKELFTKMSIQLDMDSIDFDGISATAQNLLERSNSIGAVHVSNACTDILNSCRDQDTDRCKQALIKAKREFGRLQIKFESVVELEEEIIECEDMQGAAQG